MEAFLDFLNKKTGSCSDQKKIMFFVYKRKQLNLYFGSSRKHTKSDKKYIKLRSVSMKTSLIVLKSAQCVFFITFTCKKIQAKIFKVTLFWSHTVCNGVIFRKSNSDKVKVSSNHLKFYTGCFCDICRM